MFDTAKELHIGIDQGLQAINSNRKGTIEASEKDWVLNTVMIEQINARLDPRSNVKGREFEDTIKSIDDLESIKEDSSELNNLTIYKYSDNASYAHLPANYHRLLAGSVSVRKYGTSGSPVVGFSDMGYRGGSPVTTNYSTNYCTVKLPSAISDYSDFIIRFLYNHSVTTPGSEAYTEAVLFDINEEGAYWSSITGDPLAIYYKHGVETLQSAYADGKFQFIGLVMDHINNVTGVDTGISVYWERFGNIYEKDSFIFVINTPDAAERITSYDKSLSLSNKIYLSPTGDSPNTPGDEDSYGVFEGYYNNKALEYVESFERSAIGDITIFTAVESAAYTAATFVNKPIRVVKSNELERLLKHYYGKTIWDSPIGVIRNGRLVVYHDNTFEFDRIDMEYYRKPRAISLLNNQGCEISSNSFKIALVEKSVQKISSRILDPNYQNVVRENLQLD